MKKISILFLSLYLCFLLSIISLGASYTAYSSVTPSTGNISLLIQTMFNQDDFDVFKDWVAIRTDEYDYSIFYNINSGDAVRLRYYGTQSGYNIVYNLTKSIESNFSYNSGRYTVVGNTSDTLASSDYNTYLFQYILKISVPFILVIFIFFIFRIRKRSRGINI